MVGPTFFRRSLWALILVAACLALPGCVPIDRLKWRLSNKAALFAAIAAVCVTVAVANERRKP
jgi:hypothetical protein